MPIISGGSVGSGSASAIAATTISATPPGGPVTGTLWVYPADDTNGVYWSFVYDAAETTYKWRFAGGPPLFQGGFPAILIGGASMTQVGATGFWYPTASGSFSTPRAGDYECWGQGWYRQIAGFTAPNNVGPGVSNGTAIANRSRTQSGWASALTTVDVTASAYDVITGVAAATTVGVVHSSGDATHVNLEGFGMYLRPIRVI